MNKELEAISLTLIFFNQIELTNEKMLPSLVIELSKYLYNQKKSATFCVLR